MCQVAEVWEIYNLLYILEVTDHCFQLSSCFSRLYLITNVLQEKWEINSISATMTSPGQRYYDGLRQAITM